MENYDVHSMPKVLTFQKFTVPLEVADLDQKEIIPSLFIISLRHLSHLPVASPELSPVVSDNIQLIFLSDVLSAGERAVIKRAVCPDVQYPRTGVPSGT